MVRKLDREVDAGALDRRPTVREMGEHPDPWRRDNYVHMDTLPIDSVDKETLARMRGILAPPNPEEGT